MSNVYPISSQEKRQDEASVWIAKLDRQLSDAESQELQRWMAADPRNEALLVKMAEIWDKSDALSRLSSVFPLTPIRSSAPLIPRFALAASIVVLVVAGLWGVGNKPFSSYGLQDSAKVASQGVYETAIGDHSTVELSDGSKLDMNTNSRVRVAYSAGQRLVFLERGEINVDVFPDKSRPLSVVVGDRVIRAVGTAFSVKLSSSQEIELVVSHGKVRVGVRPDTATASKLGPITDIGAEAGMIVEKGGFVILSDATPQIETLTPEEIEVRLSWADGNLIFRGEPLSDIVAEISRYTTIEFVFLDEDIKTVRVAGLFKAGDVAGFLATLQANFNIVYEQIEDDRILLKPKAESSP